MAWLASRRPASMARSVRHDVHPGCPLPARQGQRERGCRTPAACRPQPPATGGAAGRASRLLRSSRRGRWRPCSRLPHETLPLDHGAGASASLNARCAMLLSRSHCMLNTRLVEARPRTRPCRAVGPCCGAPHATPAHQGTQDAKHVCAASQSEKSESSSEPDLCTPWQSPCRTVRLSTASASGSESLPSSTPTRTPDACSRSSNCCQNMRGGGGVGGGVNTS